MPNLAETLFFFKKMKRDLIRNAKQSSIVQDVDGKFLKAIDQKIKELEEELKEENCMKDLGEIK